MKDAFACAFPFIFTGMGRLSFLSFVCGLTVGGSVRMLARALQGGKGGCRDAREGRVRQACSVGVL